MLFTSLLVQATRALTEAGNARIDRRRVPVGPAQPVAVIPTCIPAQLRHPDRRTTGRGGPAGRRRIDIQPRGRTGAGAGPPGRRGRPAGSMDVSQHPGDPGEAGRCPRLARRANGSGSSRLRCRAGGKRLTASTRPIAAGSVAGPDDDATRRRRSDDQVVPSAGKRCEMIVLENASRSSGLRLVISGAVLHHFLVDPVRAGVGQVGLQARVGRQGLALDDARLDQDPAGVTDRGDRAGRSRRTPARRSPPVSSARRKSDPMTPPGSTSASNARGFAWPDPRRPGTLLPRSM